MRFHDRLCGPEGSTNRGNTIGPLAMDDLENAKRTWRLTVKQKFQLLGRNARLLAGGNVDDDQSGNDMVVDEESHLKMSRQSKG